MNDGLAGRIRKCAEIAGSGDALSQKTSIPRSTLETYLTGKAEPKASRLAAIATAANVSADWLLFGYGDMNGRHRYSNPHAASLALVDEDLSGRVVEAVAAVHEECSLAISSCELGRLAAQVYNEIASAGLESWEEKIGALRLVSGQLRRRLLAAGKPPPPPGHKKYMA